MTSDLPKGAPNTEIDNQYPLTANIVDTVASSIGVNFESFGLHLGLSQQVISNITYDKPTAHAKAVAVITNWTEKNGILKWEQLKKELLSKEYKLTVEKIDEGLKQSGFPTMPSVLPADALNTGGFPTMPSVLPADALNTGGLFTMPSVLPGFALNTACLSEENSISGKTVIFGNELKKFYLNTYKTIDEMQPILDKSCSVNLIDNFVDLYVVNEDNVKTDAISIEELDQFLKKQVSYPSILFEKKLEDLSLILISGNAAIGKTWLLRKSLLDWSNGLIWKNIDFLFYLEGEKLKLHEDISDINKLLDILKGDSISLDLIKSNISIMFIIDGLNEFKDFDKFPILNIFTEFYKYKSIKAVISGRVNTISQYEKVISQYEKGDKRYIGKLTIRVIGYNEVGIKNYLRNNLIKKTKRRVKTILKESSIAKIMAKVPFFLSCMCKIFNNSKEKCNFKNLTMTDLYALNFLCFLQKYIFNENYEVCEMMKNNDNKQCILNICEMAYIFLNNNKTTFSDEEIQEFSSGFDQIESGLNGKMFLLKSDFIEKIETPCGCYYHFCHPEMMKLCVSVYAYYSLSGKNIMENPKLMTCLSIICGLLNADKRSFVKPLANLTNSNAEKISLNHVIEVIPKEINFNREYQDRQKLFMQCFFESQATITDDIKASIDERNWKISINNSKTSYEVLCEKYFVNHLYKSEGKLKILEIEKIFLTDEEKILIEICSRNVEEIYRKRSFRSFIDQITRRWMKSK